MRAMWNGAVIAEASTDELISIENNWYFPPSSLKREYVSDSDVHTTCVWKGEANYYDVMVDGQTNPAAAWYYPEPKVGSEKRVGKDYKDYVAFWRSVEVVEA